LGGRRFEFPQDGSVVCGVPVHARPVFTNWGSWATGTGSEWREAGFRVDSAGSGRKFSRPWNQDYAQVRGGHRVKEVFNSTGCEGWRSRWFFYTMRE
jgi:hypothetical protein